MIPCVLPTATWPKTSIGPKVRFLHLDPTTSDPAPGYARIDHLNKIAKVVAFCLFGLMAVMALAGSPANAQVVATVDAVTVEKSDLVWAAQRLQENGVNKLTDKQLIDYVIDIRLIAKEALRRSLGGVSTENKTIEDDYRLAVLLLNIDLSEAASVTALQDLFEESIAAMRSEHLLRTRHILVQTEQEAFAILGRLQVGEDFPRLASQLSLDQATKTKGGDVGFMARSNLDKEYADAAFALKLGTYSRPVKTSFGWHIIKAEEIKAVELPRFIEVEDKLIQYISNKQQAELVKRLRSNAKISYVTTP